MRRVIIESPYAGDIEANVAYARRCIRDALKRGEAPIASHLLFAQPGILRDDVPEERQLGIAAGLAWIAVADAMVLYLDRGTSPGMQEARRAAEAIGLQWELRHLDQPQGEVRLAGDLEASQDEGRARQQPAQGGQSERRDALRLVD